MQGRFIVLDGIDGSGTTTQADRLAQHFRAKGRDVVLTKEPSTGPIGVLIRQQLSAGHAVNERALALLFAADRIDHIQREILPAVARGDLVICDRYILSSLAYQALHCPLEWVGQINCMYPDGWDEACRINGCPVWDEEKGVPVPLYHPADLTFFFEIDPELAQERVRSRAGVVERFDALDLQRRVAKNYKDCLSILDGERVIRVDASKTVEELTAELVFYLEKLSA